MNGRLKQHQQKTKTNIGSQNQKPKSRTKIENENRKQQSKTKDLNRKSQNEHRKQIPFDGPYGTKSEKMACPLSALIEARFTDFTREGKDYPDVSVLDKKFVSIGRPSGRIQAGAGFK